MEKSLSTPDYYPLSLNALAAACNQKSNRDPVVTYSESEMQTALEDLEEKHLVNQSGVGRVPKYEEQLSRKYNLVPREVAALCVLMLRGPQTAGEIRGRSGRLCEFENLEAVSETLAKLADWGLAQRLARLPGHKESRFAHLLGVLSEPAVSENVTDVSPADPTLVERVAMLESELEQLRSDMDKLKQALQAFKAQFE
jgi:uncharacterized protein YceH (UPF0502 family)